MSSDQQTIPTESAAHFKAVVRQAGGMVAGIAIVQGKGGRFFIRQKRESEDAFVGRVSGWIKENGGSSLQMLPPEMLPDGAPTGEVLMRLKHSLGIPRDAPEAAEYALENVSVDVESETN